MNTISRLEAEPLPHLLRPAAYPAPRTRGLTVVANEVLTAPMNDTTQTERAVSVIRDLIVSGVVLPGERLGEVQLAERLGMSRTPVRSALITLGHEGLVEAFQGRGYVVASFAADDLRDAVELRGQLEGAAARYSAERGVTAAQIEELHQVLRELDRVFEDPGTWDDHVHGYIELNERFHRLLVDAARNPVLARLYENLIRLPFASPSDLVVGYWHLPGSRDKFAAAQHQHWAIFESITARRGTRAEFLGREHAEITIRALDELLRNGALERVQVSPRTRGASLTRRLSSSA